MRPDRPLVLALAIAAFAFATVPAPAASPSRPDIVFILADDLGYGDLGCYGQETIETPNLDRMAAEGIRFLSAYSGSTVCAPSRCALMTGLHTGRCRVRGNALVPLEPEDVTVAETLRDAGYRTAIFGKWGLGEPGTEGTPNRQGFDEWFGYLNQQHAHDYYTDHLWENETRFPLPGNAEGRREQYAHDVIAERALAWLADAVERPEPFFLYLAVTPPHANNERGAATGDGMEVPDYGPYAERDWPNPEKGFAAMVRTLDRDVGRVLDALRAKREAGAARDALVVFASDNGPHREGGHDPDFFRSSGPLRGIKRALYEGGIRVPAIAWRPGAIEPRVEPAPWAFWDFLPTAAELAGASVPEGLDGVSFAPLLGDAATARSYDAARPFYWEFHERGFSQAVRRGKWKGVRTGLRKPLELYDLDADLGETNDLAASEPGVVAELDAWLAGARTPNPDFRVKGLDP